MKIRQQNKPIAELPAAATSDIAFILIVFFVVCAAVQPDDGRRQEIPRSEEKEQKTEQSENLEVALTRETVSINGNLVPLVDFPSRIQDLLAKKASAEDRIVVVKSQKDTPYHHWIQVTAAIEDSGGTITLQLQEEQVQIVP